MKRVSNLPQVTLKATLSAALSRPQTLTESEIRFARRIRECCNCNHLWVQRGRELPRRCPNCMSTQWNMPNLRAIAQNEPTPRADKKQEAVQ